MDLDRRRLNDLEIKIFRERFNSVPNAGTVLQPVRLRRLIQDSVGLDRFLLAYGFDFLWRCGLFSWLIFLIEKVF